MILPGANDVIVVPQSDGTLKSTPFHVQIGKFANWKTVLKSRQGRKSKFTQSDLK